ncbi:hypothetical protein GCM10009122_27040 [Fulvivirga kasyanovii]|uniref:Beta-lactamase-related domain-containing protein n=1 Tax=Fulvivirga kasyanovii TaxID=396812 RepID=A0ABW9RL58_9BACT|nr:serine hydrolase [Fulvivirga kasyanovii]MTI24827.1 hypothetical protein [Fulvivirga kasyanovii]
MRGMLLFALVLFTISFDGKAQINITGKVLTSKGGEPIPYANIGILNSEIGTISNADGTFALIIPEKYHNEHLIFSSIGFTRKSIPVVTIKADRELSVLLEEKVVTLNAVTISAQKEKKKSRQFGNGKSLLLSGQLYSDTLSAGSAMALFIDKKDYPDLTYIQKVSLYIAKNKFPSFKVRLRFLNIDHETLKPGADILHEQVIETSDLKKGWLDFTLPHNLEIREQSFYIMCEWILDSKDRQYIADKYAEYMELYPDRVSYDTVLVQGEKLVIPKVSMVVAGTVFGTTHSKADLEENSCFYRTNSFGEWKRSAGVLSVKLELSNYPLMEKSENLSTPCPDSSVACQVDHWVENFRQGQSFMGLQLAISSGGETVFSKGYGYSDAEREIAVLNTTQFRVASISKSMTAAGLMKLTSENNLNLDTAIQVYVPSFPVKHHPVTARQLAGHLGGIRGYHGKSWDEIFIQDHFNSCTDALALFKDDPLAVKPGTEFLYSSYGYTLLGAMIENVSGQHYLEYMNNTVWKPLKMLHTYGDIKDSVMLNKSKFYYLSGKEAEPYDLSYSYATGGLVSTSEDLLKFGEALLDTEFLDKQTKSQLFTTQYTEDKQPTHYGMGWYLSKDNNGCEVWYHTGELPSSGSILLIYPQKGIVISILANSPILSGDTLLYDIQKLVEIVEAKS